MSHLEPTPPPRRLRALAVAGVVAAAAVAARRLELPACDQLQELFAAWGVWAALAYCAVFVAASVALVPGLVLAVVAGAVYGPVLGTILASVGSVGVLLIRLAPLVPFNASNYACGLLPVAFRDYLIGSALGMLPGAFAYCYFGDAGCSALAPLLHGGFALSALPQDVLQRLVIATAIMGGLALVPILVKRLRSLS
jgi:uncharacterized membrane protein YdjX (TVP38/TMEM64 family)